MIPAEIRRLNQWVGWKKVGEDERKVPINVESGKAARSNDRTSWGSYRRAVESISKFQLNGIGFVFDGAGLVGIDLDDCIVNGVLCPMAERIVRDCRSYTEVSQSGTGLHIIVRGKIPRALKTGRKLPDGTLTDKIEIYDRERYFAITGKQWPGTPSYIRQYDNFGQWYGDNYTAGRAPTLPIEQRLANIGDGNRNETFTSLAGTYRNYGADAEKIFSLLWPIAEREKFPKEELWGICERIGGKKLPDGLQQADKDAEEFDTEAFLAGEEKIDWLSPGVLARGTITFFAGLSESGKTWAMTDLAIEAARGGKWLGKIPLKECKVWYIEQERSPLEVRRRFNALLKAKGIKVPKNLAIKPGGTFRINSDRSYAAFQKRLAEIKPDLVIVDPFKRFHTLNELSTPDMIFVTERLHQLRLAFGCSFMILHHEPKGVIQRRSENNEVTMFDAAGTADLQNASEHFWNVVKDKDKGSWMFMTKNTYGKKIAPVLYQVNDLLPDSSSIEVKAV